METRPLYSLNKQPDLVEAMPKEGFAVTYGDQTQLYSNSGIKGQSIAAVHAFLPNGTIAVVVESNQIFIFSDSEFVTMFELDMKNIDRLTALSNGNLVAQSTQSNEIQLIFVVKTTPRILRPSSPVRILLR